MSHFIAGGMRLPSLGFQQIICGKVSIVAQLNQFKHCLAIAAVKGSGKMALHMNVCTYSIDLNVIMNSSDYMTIDKSD